MGHINREWHLANRMPEKPTEKERAVWHIEHVKSCGCRKPSEKEIKLMEKYSE